MEIDLIKAKEFILKKFNEQGDFSIFDAKDLDQMVEAVLSLDAQFMKDTGVDDGEVYDDDAAYDFMFEKMSEKFADQKMYMMRLVEDYMDYNEEYLESIGAIDWD